MPAEFTHLMSLHKICNLINTRMWGLCTLAEFSWWSHLFHKWVKIIRNKHNFITFLKISMSYFNQNYKAKWVIILLDFFQIGGKYSGWKKKVAHIKQNDEENTSWMPAIVCWHCKAMKFVLVVFVIKVICRVHTRKYSFGKMCLSACKCSIHFFSFWIFEIII